MKLSVGAILVGGAFLTLLIPPVIFLGAALQSGLGMSESFSALLAQYTSSRQNLLVCGSIGLLPLALQALILWLMKRFSSKEQSRVLIALGGLVPVLIVLVWVNVSFWPLFLPARTYPGFPHGLEFVIGPLFVAPVVLIIGMLVSWLLTRQTARGVR